MHIHKFKKKLHNLIGYFLPMLFWVSVMFGFDTPAIAILTLTVAIIHELGHIAVMLFLGNRQIIPRGHATGFRLTADAKNSYKNEALILAGGPAANIVCAILFLPSLIFFGDYGLLFISLNILTALSNLIPAEGYDGYGILSLYAEWCGKSTLPLMRLSFSVSVFFTFLSLYLIGRLGGGFWIFGIFFVSVISKIRNMLKYDIF